MKKDFINIPTGYIILNGKQLKASPEIRNKIRMPAFATLIINVLARTMRP